MPDVGVTGVNDPDCRSDDRPVLLLHGTFGSVRRSFSAFIPRLLDAGRCVFGVDYGNGGLDPVEQSARETAQFARRILTETGAEQLDVVGYSQGGLVLRAVLRFGGLAGQVATAALIAPTFHGTTVRGLDQLGAVCGSCLDQAANSPLLQRLAAGGDLDGEVRYAVISTRRDTVVTPLSSQVPAGPPDRVRSLVLESVCPDVVTEHRLMPYQPAVLNWVIAALDTDGRPDPTATGC